MSNDPDRGIFPGVTIDGYDKREEWGDCGCGTCVSERLVQRAGNAFGMPFIVCPDCGNKRCPKATHHDHACSGSNEPGQAGSRYA